MPCTASETLKLEISSVSGCEVLHTNEWSYQGSWRCGTTSLSTAKYNSSWRTLDWMTFRFKPQRESKEKSILRTSKMHAWHFHKQFSHDSQGYIWQELIAILVPQSWREDQAADGVVTILWTTLHLWGHVLWAVSISQMYIQILDPMNRTKWKPLDLIPLSSIREFIVSVVVVVVDKVTKSHGAGWYWDRWRDATQEHNISLMSKNDEITLTTNSTP